MQNKELKQITTRRQADIIAREHVQQYKDELFAKNASEILQQVMAAVLITLEKGYGWKQGRLWNFVNYFKMYLEMMQTPDFLHEKWDNDDNIEYIKSEYGIDLRELFQATIDYGGR